ncbi:MAG: M15 family metallopeptidase [Flavobacteriales bacterium]
MRTWILGLFASVFAACAPADQPGPVGSAKVEGSSGQTETIQPEPASDAKSWSKAELMGKVNPSTDTSFTRVNDAYCNKPTYLRKEAYAAFLKMREAAQKDGLTLLIVSGTRNFQDQKVIWERKWDNLSATIADSTQRALEILKFSSMPGTSRHHWGTDMDFNALEDAYFTSGVGLKIYQWLSTHAHEYGFCQVYSDKANGRTGYNMEKWHWSYMPLSSSFLTQYINQVSYADFGGFKGSGVAKGIDMIQNYVQGIEPTCK